MAGDKRGGREGGQGKGQVSGGREEQPAGLTPTPLRLSPLPQPPGLSPVHSSTLDVTVSELDSNQSTSNAVNQSR